MTLASYEQRFVFSLNICINLFDREALRQSQVTWFLCKSLHMTYENYIFCHWFWSSCPRSIGLLYHLLHGHFFPLNKWEKTLYRQTICIRHRGLVSTVVTSACSVQFSSVAQSCLTLCDPMNRSTPGFPVHHQLPEFTQTHAHWVGDATQPSHSLSSPSPPAPNPSQHQGFFPVSQLWWPKYWNFSFSMSFQWTPRNDLL